MDFSSLGKVRSLHRLFAVFHAVFIGMVAWGAIIAIDLCPGDVSIACLVAAAASAIRLLWMIGSAVSQAAVASAMLSERLEPPSTITVTGSKMTSTIRQKRRMWYVRWLWWGRFGTFVTLLQLVGAAYLTFSFLKYASISTNPCYSVHGVGGWHRGFFLAMALAAWLLTVTQCCIGPDILAWSSLYARHNDAWRAHYHEMFDYGIREALCCLGRAQYITGNEDEVDSVAAVLGDLVSYQAAGAGHLEFLAGLALLHLEGSSASSSCECAAPTPLIREAAVLHPFAVAAYTGPLLDIGRSFFMFPCAWLHRQGVLTLWNRNRLPKLDGDNWWRGHAAAFLKHSKLPSEALRQGRVHQAKRECAYFVTVVHELQSVVIAVRGTETPEDLLTDGLGRESILTSSDLAGLLLSDRIADAVKHQLMSSSSHFAHEGIIDAARELAWQLDNLSEDEKLDTGSKDQESTSASKELGILSRLLGPGGECEGYSLYFVGHSLGGSIAALTALRFYARYPQVHAYGYGVLPCIDASVADACSDFVTSIVYNDEFSSRLSISSIKRLRIAAVKALALEPSSDFGTVTKLARRLLGPQSPVSVLPSCTQALTKDVTVVKPLNKHKGRRFEFKLKGGIYLCSHACHCMIHMSNYSSSRPPRSLLIDFPRCRPPHSHSLKVVSKGLSGHANEVSTDALNFVESFVVTGDGGRHMPVSSITVDNGFSDKENVLCVNAGRGGNNDDEESEVLVLAENMDEHRHPSTSHVKPTEDVKHSIGDLSPTVESGQTGKEPCHCESNTITHHQTIYAGHCEEQDNYREMFLPGLVVHLVPERQSSRWPPWNFWGKKVQQICQHRAFIKDRKKFQDLVISASMFLDHMPWRCQHALNHVLEFDRASSKDINGCRDLLV